MEILQRINSPADLRKLNIDQLQDVASDIREHILETMSRVGGHTGASLGAVELAVALHYAFDTPHDRLVWDVGHQAYAHKILTGRRDLFRPRLDAVLQDTVEKRRGMRTLLRGVLRQDEGQTTVTTTGPQGSGILRSMSLANCLIDLPEDTERLQPGARVQVMLL